MRVQKSWFQSRAEDWGWFSFVDWRGRKYTLGSSASDEENGEREWILQIEKQRSWGEKILGRAKMDRDDECARYFRRILENEPSFNNLAVEP